MIRLILLIITIIALPIIGFSQARVVKPNAVIDTKGTALSGDELMYWQYFPADGKWTSMSISDYLTMRFANIINNGEPLTILLIDSDMYSTGGYSYSRQFGLHRTKVRVKSYTAYLIPQSFKDELSYVLSEKNGSNISLLLYEIGTISANYKNQRKRDDEMMSKIAHILGRDGMIKNKTTPMCMLVNAQSIKGIDVVRFLLPSTNNCTGVHLNLKYYETGYDAFKEFSSLLR